MAECLTAEGIMLSAEQQSVYDHIESSNSNFFITGKAGTGKSVLLRYFVQSTAKKVAVLAPTGIAAVNVGGQTIHSFFALDTTVQNTKNRKEVYSGMTDERRAILSSIQTLIIDEISMVRVDVMDMIDCKLKNARDNTKPFGGCQIILFGDLYQLPPVVGSDTDVERFLMKRYGTTFFFGAPACKNTFEFVELTQVFRQNDSVFVNILNDIRIGKLSWDNLEVLNLRQCKPLNNEGVISLTPRNESAHRINHEKVKNLPTPEFVYTGEIEGAFELDDLPTEMALTLKVGAQVMLLRNDSQRRWYNGSIGQIAELSDDLIKVNINGDVYPIDIEVWKKYIYHYDPEGQTITREAVGSFRQYPLRLAYAITIHKSQGQTFDSVIIDYDDGSAFAPGQTYVALSRCRSLDSLFLTSQLSLEDVRVNQEVVDFMKRYLPFLKGAPLMIGKDMQVLYGQRFSDSVAVLTKDVNAQVQKTIKRLMENPELPGLNVEKIGDDGMFTARVNDNFRLVFAIPDGAQLLSLLYVGAHEDAYQFANKHKLEINPITGGLQQVEKAPKKMTKQSSTGKLQSRLAALSEEQLVALQIPEEYWPQLQEKVFTVGQLVGFKSLLPQDVYDTLEFILDGAPVEEAMSLWESMNTTVAPVKVEERTPIFDEYSAEELISVGIPMENVDKVKHIKTEKELEIISANLPILAQQALYALKSGETIEDVRKTTYNASKQNAEGDYTAAVSSPITLAEFAPIHSEEALRAIMEYPRDKWRVFLHPTQSEIVHQDYNGPARIVGGAGTGKTVVIVHRAKRLAAECNGSEKILVTTFGNTLKHDIDERIRDMCSEDELAHIAVYTVDKLTSDLTRAQLGGRIAYPSGSGIKLGDLWDLAMKASAMSGAFATEFCIDEWRDVVQAQNITTLEGYLSATRYGRGKQLDRASRERFWKTAEAYVNICGTKGAMDADLAQNRLVETINNNPNLRQYKTVIVDECQDLRTPALRMLRALAGEQRKNDMYLSGDSRQRIYGGRVSLSQCGININNRSRVLKLNYRTTEEIYNFALQLQRDYQYDDMDGKSMSKDKCNCIFHGPAPFVREFSNPEEEVRELIRDIRQLIEKGVIPADICIMVRSNALLSSFRRSLEMNGLQVLTVDNKQPDDKSISGVRIMTMHRGKGMEYAYVYLPSLRDEVIPRKLDIEKVEDNDMLNEILLSEANLLSVAITRAKHQVWLSYSGKPSTLIQSYIM